jgi:hypothetical protein
MALLPNLSGAAECVARSGAVTTALVELYTSEGCDSCPPADRWFSGFQRTDPRFVPIAFHVDYWDYLGWKDAYGDPRHSERQRRLARTAGARAVYTPQVILSGRDFAAWRNASAVSKAIGEVNAHGPRAHLEIATMARPAARVSATLADGRSPSDLAVVVAVTQNAITTQVKAGEKRGRSLRHDFVARDVQVRDWPRGKNAFAADVEFKARPDWNLAQMSVVAFVQDVKTGEVLQALSAPICLSGG